MQNLKSSSMQFIEVESASSERSLRHLEQSIRASDFRSNFLPDAAIENILCEFHDAKLTLDTRSSGMKIPLFACLIGNASSYVLFRVA